MQSITLFDSINCSQHFLTLTKIKILKRSQLYSWYNNLQFVYWIPVITSQKIFEKGQLLYGILLVFLSFRFTIIHKVTGFLIWSSYILRMKSWIRLDESIWLIHFPLKLRLKNIANVKFQNLKGHSKIWDSFWQLKALSENDERCFLLQLESSFCYQDIEVFSFNFWSSRKTTWLKRYG